ncbi:peptidoglycan recognition protein family protein [Bacillus sp. 0909A]|uniref:peptidoglycan recognition protein family protein n=1 Tax=Bacillus sp. 0909A TaxID=3120561 RepID=UPI002FDAA295
MVAIKKDFIPKSNDNRPGYAMTPAYITVHNTANTAKGADAKMHADYVKNPSTSVSWHFTVDDSDIYQHLPLTENGWHAGDGTDGTGNRKSIGIEICENADGNFDKAVANAQWLIKKLMKDHNISLDRVVPHKKWSGKECPRKLLNQWSAFKNGISSSDTPSKESPKSYPLPSGVIKLTAPYRKGTKVLQLQKALAALHFYPDKGAKNNGIDGIYGPKTANAVKRFQLMNGLKADGIYGPKTKAKLKAKLK